MNKAKKRFEELKKQYYRDFFEFLKKSSEFRRDIEKALSEQK